MLPSEEIKERINIVDLVSEYVQLKKAGVNFRGLCPFHDEKSPSFLVSPTKQIWHCFGCFPPGQKVKTPFGYHNIEDLNEDHHVISGEGQIRKILATMQRDYHGQIIDVRVRKLGGIVSLTADHNLKVFRPKTRYYRESKQFYRQLRDYQTEIVKDYDLLREQIIKHADLIQIPAGELRTDDFVLYPIGTAVNKFRDINLEDYLTKSYHFGPIPKQIPLKVKLNNDLLKLIGYYVAEGSSHRAYIRFSLGNHEAEFANEIVVLVKRIFGLEASIHKRVGDKTGIEITACHSLLANIFENLCGKGAAQKHIPFIFQELAPKQQLVLIRAIHRGDGHSYIANRSNRLHNSITTVSRILAEQVVDILLRNHQFPSLQITSAYHSKMQVNHKESYHVNWSESAKPQHSLIYKASNNSMYWLLPIKSVSHRAYQGPVYNLTVDQDHSYVAANFAVANCGLGGDIFEFVKQAEGVEFPEALRMLAARAGVTLRQQSEVSYQAQTDQKKVLFEINNWAAAYYSKVLQDSPAASPAREYLKQRGLHPETIAKWRIGYAPDDFHVFENFIVKKGYQKREVVAAGLLAERAGDYFDRFRGRVMFPLLDIHGQVVGFTGRILQDVPEAPKYVNSPETLIYSKSHLVYGLNFAKAEIRKKDEVIVVEGNMDAITAQEAGFANVVASSGTALTSMQLQLLQRFTNHINFAFDVDEAGLTATRRAVELALTSGFNVRIVSIPKGLAKDPDELIRRDPGLWAGAVSEAKNFLDFYFEAIFANIDLDSSTDKKRAAAELLPLLSLLPEELDRVHYVQKLALRLGVNERILLDLLNRQMAGGKRSLRKDKPPLPRSGKTKQEILEQRTLALLLKFADNLIAEWSSLQVRDFTTPLWRQIFEAAAAAAVSGKFNLQRFIEEYPKFAGEVNIILFALENEMSLDEERTIEDLKKEFVAALRLNTLKHEMQLLQTQIRQAESSGSTATSQRLIQEFNNLTKELGKYHGQS